MPHVGLPDGVTVAQQTLNLFVMVQIHVGQPSSIYDFVFSIHDLPRALLVFTVTERWRRNFTFADKSTNF